MESIPRTIRPLLIAVAAVLIVATIALLLFLLAGGGLRVTVLSPGTASMSAAYGLATVRRPVRTLGLSDDQLARVQLFEKEFLATVDRRTADVY